ncbi:MAG: trimethylamine methyltransferase family protein, partial [Eubacterium sp.]
VYIDEVLFKRAMETVPEAFIIRSCKGDVAIGKGSKVFLPAGGNVYIQDNGAIRAMSNEDNINQFKLYDTSPVISCDHVNIFLDEQEQSLKEKIFGPVAFVLKYANKPSIHTKINTFPIKDKNQVRESFKKGLKLVKQFEGLDEAYVKISSINPISPLCYDHDPLEKIIAACEENQPLWIISAAMPILSGPTSVASIMAMTNAEILAGIVLTQLLKPGIPVVYGNTSTSTDMRTLQMSLGSPETALIIYATAALADYYKLPFRTGGLLSDAKDLDVQAGSESTLLGMATLDCAPDMVLHSIGVLGSFNLVNFEKILVDEEIIMSINRMLRGIDCSKEKLCYDLIKTIGPRGSCLNGRTPKMFKEEFIMSKYFNKVDANQWQSSGSPSIRDTTHEDVLKRIESYKVPQITKEQDDLIREYLPEQYRDRI